MILLTDTDTQADLGLRFRICPKTRFRMARPSIVFMLLFQTGTLYFYILHVFLQHIPWNGLLSS